MRGASTGLKPYGSVGNIYSPDLNIFNESIQKNYGVLRSPPSTTRGAVSAAIGTPDYINNL